MSRMRSFELFTSLIFAVTPALSAQTDEVAAVRRVLSGQEPGGD